MQDIIKMIVVLSLIMGIAGFALSMLKQTTDPTIELQVLTYVQGPAIYSVFKDVDNDPIEDRQTLTLPDGQEKTFFPAKKNGELLGVAFETSAGGYGGDIGVMVGINMKDENLMGLGVTTHKETPGLGAKITLPSFSDQFQGKAFDDDSIDAISGATISSVGVKTAVESAVGVYQQMKDEIQKAFSS